MEHTKTQVVGASDLSTMLEHVEKLERENKQLKLEIETLKMQLKTSKINQYIDSDEPIVSKSKKALQNQHVLVCSLFCRPVKE